MDYPVIINGVEMPSVGNSDTDLGLKNQDLKTHRIDCSIRITKSDVVQDTIDLCPDDLKEFLNSWHSYLVEQNC